MRRPDTPFLDQVIQLTWRDSFQDDGQIKPKDITEDCVWNSYGLVAKESDRFISIAFGKDQVEGDLADVLSVPWEMVLRIKVLE